MQDAMIVLTGATGRVGRHLLPALIGQGYKIRVLTPDPPPPHEAVEWRRTDFRETLDFDEALAGAAAVLHVGAELVDTSVMERVNVDATRELAQAAERNGIGYFCYISSICVYGSPRSRTVTETTAFLDPRRNPPENDYFADADLREYGRTKMLGEVALGEVARDATYVVLRPTAISTLEDVLVTSTWSLPTKIWRGYRHSHRIFMDDVVHAIQYFLAEALSGRVHHPGRVEAYNLSNDDVPGYSYGAVLRAAYAKTRRREFWCPVDAPGWLDVVKDLIKFRSTRLRYPIGMIHFSPEKLYATGYRHKLGVKEAHRRLLEQLS